MATITRALRPRAVPWDAKVLAFTFILLLLAFAVVYPFLILVWDSFVVSDFGEARRFGLDSWRFAFTDKGMLQALWNTMLVMVARQGISFPIAIFVAWLIARTDLPYAKWLEFAFWIAFFMPVIPVTQAWILLAHPSAGLLNHAVTWLPGIEKGPFNIYSFWGIVWVHLVTNTIAIKVMLLTPAFRNMDAALEDASRTAGASPLRTLFRITVPVLTPAIVTVLMLAVLRAAQSVEIEVILGLPIRFFVFGSKIFSLVRDEPPEFGAATAMGLMIVIVIAPLILWQRWATTRRQFTTLTGKYGAGVLPLRRWRWPAFALVASMCLMMTVVPIIFLLMGSFMTLYGFFEVPAGAWTLDHWRRVVTDSVFFLSIKNTMYLGLGAATLSTVFFTLLAYAIVRMRTRLRAVADFLTWIPYVLPGIVIVIAWMSILLDTPIFRPLYGTIFALILVSGLSGITLGVQIIRSNLLQLGLELEEASSITGAGWATTLMKVVIPLLSPAMVVVWVLNFIAATGTAIMPALLASHASRPIALLQFELVMSGLHEEAAIVGLFVVAMTIGVAVIARVLGFRVGLGRVGS